MSAIDRTWASYMMPQIIPSFSKNTQSEQVHSRDTQALGCTITMINYPLGFLCYH
jgi:hypothetical protein